MNIKNRLASGIKENLPHGPLDGFLRPIRVFRPQRRRLEFRADQDNRSAARNFSAGVMACSAFHTSVFIAETDFKLFRRHAAAP